MSDKMGVFISYQAKDANKVRSLTKRLNKDLRLNAVVVENVRAPSTPLSTKVKDGIERCTYFVPILTRNSIGCQWVNQEIGYAEAKRMRVFAIIDRRLLDRLKGFVHKGLDLPYLFDSDKNYPRKEATSFAICCNQMIEDINAEIRRQDTAEKELSGPGLSDYSKAVVKGWTPMDVAVRYLIEEGTTLNLKIMPSDPGLEFISYFLFETDYAQGEETKWIGFTNKPNFHYSNAREDTRTVQGNSLTIKVAQVIRERSLSIKGKPLMVRTLRFRGDKSRNAAVDFYYKLHN